jgi:hypothetical protein
MWKFYLSYSEVCLTNITGRLSSGKRLAAAWTSGIRFQGGAYRTLMQVRFNREVKIKVKLSLGFIKHHDVNMYGEVEAQDGDECLAPRRHPGELPPSPRYAFYNKLGGPQNRPGRCGLEKKSLAPAANRTSTPRSSSPYPHCYTDWATPAATVVKVK